MLIHRWYQKCDSELRCEFSEPCFVFHCQGHYGVVHRMAVDCDGVGSVASLTASPRTSPTTRSSPVAGHRADGGIAVLNGSKAVQTRSQASRRPFNQKYGRLQLNQVLLLSAFWWFSDSIFMSTLANVTDNHRYFTALH